MIHSADSDLKHTSKTTLAEGKTEDTTANGLSGNEDSCSKDLTEHQQGRTPASLWVPDFRQLLTATDLQASIDDVNLIYYYVCPISTHFT